MAECWQSGEEQRKRPLPEIQKSLCQQRQSISRQWPSKPLANGSDLLGRMEPHADLS